MATEYIVEDGELFEVVRTHQRAELEQVKAVVGEKKSVVDGLETQLEALNAQIAAATGELEDSKSNANGAQAVVDAAAPAATGEPTNEDGSVAVDITVADQAAQL